MEYFIDEGKPTHFLAKRQVNLIVGASGAGKTTLMFQLYKASLSGEPFLGMHVPKVKWAYISGDRSSESVRATMERVGISDSDLPIFSLVDKNMIGQSLTKKIIPALTTFNKGVRPELVLIDGFSAMVPEGNSNDYNSVAQWLGELQRFCTRQELSFLGVVHVPKIREGSLLQDPRQQAMGSNAFGGFTEDQLVINRIYKKDEENSRIIYILPRNGEERMLRASFQGGLIVPDLSEDKRIAGAAFVLEMLLVPGAVFEGHQLEHQAKQRGVSRSTYYRWLDKLVREGRLAKEARGEYRVMAGPVEDLLYEAPESAQGSEEE